MKVLERTLGVMVKGISSGLVFRGGNGGGGAATGGSSGGAAATGGASAVGSGGQGGSDVASVGMAGVQAIFDARCVLCHDASKVGLPAFPGLPLTDGAAHASLVSQPASETCGGILVVPGNPDASYLVQKVSNTMPCYGSQMPRPFEVGPVVPLTADQIETIQAWGIGGSGILP